MAASIAAAKLGELVMAFDYENINTKIEANAELLRTRLTDAGLVEGHQKDFQIVAHSMGGLISRWYIEHLGGNKVVSHLVMLGTPNAGSPWPTARDWATTAAALAINGFTTVTWPVQAVGWVLKGAQRLNNALPEMKPGNTFLTNLAASVDPHVPYTIIAGNTSIVPTLEAGGDTSRLAALLDKLSPKGALRNLLTVALFREPNDIAVSVASIKQVSPNRQPAVIVHEAACDHVTYFTNAGSLDRLRSAIKWGDERSAARAG